MKSKIYIAGKITDCPGYAELFEAAAEEFKTAGYAVMNPAVLPEGFEHSEYMTICYAMIDVCDSVYFLNNYTQSKGAIMEHNYAVLNSKTLLYQQL